MTGKRLRYGALLAALVAVVVALPSTAQASYAQLKGAGSSWAGPAIDAWSSDVRSQGIIVNFTASGSAAGRNAYMENQADFAATDIAYLTSSDPFGGGPEAQSYAYSYIPVVAGGTTFMYNLKVGNQRITNLRLSGDTITKIFTGQITNWDDSRITRDYGRALPSQKITVVTRSDGSGASYQFTRWMSKVYGSQWNSFCGKFGVRSPCPPTEFYPKATGQVQRNGSDQVADYIASSSYGEGAIGYDEYSYALQLGIPVVKVLNSAGYYSLPTPSNVAIALQKAVIDENPSSLTFLMQNLDSVYSYNDPRTYPLSSYSYLVVPRSSRRLPNGGVVGPPPGFSNDKGKTLSTWMNYMLCGAQQSAGRLGYSPLPKNLVVGGFLQENYIPGHVAVPDTNQLNNCNNPTYSNGVNHLVKDAPQPSPCDYKTAPLDCAVVGGKAVASNGGNNGGSGNGSGNGNGPGANPSASGAANGANGGKIDPDTGLPIGSGNGAGNGDVNASPVSVTSRRGDWLLGTLAAAELVAVVAVPTAVGSWLRRRKRPTP